MIDIVSSKKAKLGASASRLESVLDMTNNNTINWSTAKSVISDTDIAQESMDLVSAQILQQVSTALFTSARQDKNVALSLIQQTIAS